MPVSWNESLSTGSALIDQQHRELFAQVASLETAMKQGKGRHQMGAILDFLGRYVVQHFKDEENLMDQLACPAAAVNRQAHAKFLSQFGDLRKRLEDSGTSPSLAMEAYEVVCKWLVDHIKGIDTQLRRQVDAEKRELARTAEWSEDVRLIRVAICRFFLSSRPCRLVNAASIFPGHVETAGYICADEFLRAFPA